MRRNSQKQQRINAELEGIIEEFANAMRSADRKYVTSSAACAHDVYPNFTLKMDFAWVKYIDYCLRNPK